MKMIPSMTEWGYLMETSKEKLVVVDFTASWYVMALKTNNTLADDQHD